MKTAVVYARYSCDNQTEQSIEGQLRVCEDYALRNNITIVNTYIDRAMSGTNDNRPDFQKMIKDSYKKEWDYVIVYKLDRFSRNKYETTIHKHTLAQNGIKVMSAMENIPDTPEGIILESLLEGMNQYYSAELSQKVKRGMHESRLKGHFTGGHLPFGYKSQDKKIVIDEEKAEALQFMFKEYSLGMTVPEIIKILTSRGILLNGRPFKLNTVYKIFKNKRYTGVYELNGKTYTNLYPQIIDEELFQKVQIKNHENHYGGYSVKTTYLFRNKLTCGYCGSHICSETGRTRNKTKINYYKCSGIKKYRNGCNKETIRQEVLEEFLLDSIITELEKPKTINTIIKHILEVQSEESNKNKALESLQKAKRQAEQTLNNIMVALEQGIINKTTSKRMQELEKQIELLEKEIAIEKAKTAVQITEEDIRKYYREALKQRPLQLINYIIKEIKLYNDKIEIIFNTPNKSPDPEGFSFLSKFKIMETFIGKRHESKYIHYQIIFSI